MEVVHALENYNGVPLWLNTSVKIITGKLADYLTLYNLTEIVKSSPEYEQIRGLILWPAVVEPAPINPEEKAGKRGPFGMAVVTTDDADEVPEGLWCDACLKPRMVNAPLNRGRPTIMSRCWYTPGNPSCLHCRKNQKNKTVKCNLDLAAVVADVKERGLTNYRTPVTLPPLAATLGTRLALAERHPVDGLAVLEVTVVLKDGLLDTIDEPELLLDACPTDRRSNG